MSEDNQTHHWVTTYRTVKGEPVSKMQCYYCGITYEGGIHNEEPCPEAPK